MCFIRSLWQRLRIAIKQITVGQEEWNKKRIGGGGGGGGGDDDILAESDS
jgi:hypothetical protein